MKTICSAYDAWSSCCLLLRSCLVSALGLLVAILIIIMSCLPPFLGDKNALSAAGHDAVGSSFDPARSQYTMMQGLFRPLGVIQTHASQVDVVIVSCSCFAPTPSMAAMLVNHFKMRQDVLTYNLSGMGCSSSLICVDMAKHLLKVLPEGLATLLACPPSSMALRLFFGKCSALAATFVAADVHSVLSYITGLQSRGSEYLCTVPTGAAQQGGVDCQPREHHTELVYWQRPLHAGLQLPLPDWRRCSAALQQVSSHRVALVQALQMYHACGTCSGRGRVSHCPL